MKKITTEQVRNLFASQYSSPEFPLTGSVIAKDLGVDESHQTCSHTRKAIRKAIEDGVPIGSNQKGYFLLISYEEMQECLNNLLQRQIAISKRILNLYNAYTKK